MDVRQYVTLMLENMDLFAYPEVDAIINNLHKSDSYIGLQYSQLAAI